LVIKKKNRPKWKQKLISGRYAFPFSYGSNNVFDDDDDIFHCVSVLLLEILEVVISTKISLLFR